MLDRGSAPSPTGIPPRIYKVSGHNIFKKWAPLVIFVSCLGVFVYAENLSFLLFGVLSIFLVIFPTFYYFSSTVILDSNIIVVKTVFTEYMMHRSEIGRIEIRDDSEITRVYLKSKTYFGREIALPTAPIQFDSIFHGWMESIIGEDKELLKKYRMIYGLGQV